MTTHRAATPEPAPIAATGDVWAEIIATMPPGPLREACEARRQMGVAKYGTPLQRGNGRDHRIDEAQEHLDAAAYRAAWQGADAPAVAESLARAAECLGIGGGRIDWTPGIPTKSGIYWLAGDCDGWPAVALYRVESRHPDMSPQPFRDTSASDVLEAASRYLDECRPYYTRIDQQASGGSFDVPWSTTHHARVDEPVHPATEPA